LLRPSGTEPLMRVYLETTSEEKQRQLSAYMQEALQKQ
jgi:phosphomannomutase